MNFKTLDKIAYSHTHKHVSAYSNRRDPGLQEALLGERAELLDALQREEAAAAALAPAAADPAAGLADPAKTPVMSPHEVGRPGSAALATGAGGAADCTGAVDGAAAVGGTNAAPSAVGDGAAPAAVTAGDRLPGGEGEAAEADALDAYMSSVRTQIELDKVRLDTRSGALTRTQQ